MTATPNADERRIRDSLHARIDGTPPPPRPRDWLDDYMDSTTTQPPDPPAPPVRPPHGGTEPAGEPRWDWRRLLHWPYARLVCGAAVALFPVYRGQSAALGWGTALRACRAEESVSAAWVLAGVGLGAAAVLVHRRRAWWTYALLTSAFIGTVAMASPFDIVTFTTGVTK